MEVAVVAAGEEASVRGIFDVVEAVLNWTAGDALGTSICSKAGGATGKGRLRLFVGNRRGRRFDRGCSSRSEEEE